MKCDGSSRIILTSTMFSLNLLVNVIEQKTIDEPTSVKRNKVITVKKNSYQYLFELVFEQSASDMKIN